ncbi:MAG: GTPase [Actinobacteria bacterium HGW-Actinobacteria-10]|jgi:predicted GTPase|nr:MAG: GTPase [Actinobacteria bacterium HGW-Actinobacteria-10]
MTEQTRRQRIVIMGAAGRDFHVFLTRYRHDENVEVVAFTAAQIPGIDDRRFPADLAGPLYPEGIRIRPESELEELIAAHEVDSVVFAYSDITHVDVMHKASRVLASDADFVLPGAAEMMLPSSKPVISVCAVRTGVGKSGISRRIWQRLKERGISAVDIRHPMPYRDLSKMAVERYASIRDLDDYACTIEEREEYEHLVDQGVVVYAGVDYEAILRRAEEEADVIIWDGGNNDTPFYRSDLEIVALDPHRAGHERLYHPGETNFLRADVFVVTKVDSAAPADVEAVRQAAARFNPDAQVLLTASEVTIEGTLDLKGKRVLALEDGPTVTHGGMAFGAGAIAARKAGATLVDPRPYAVGSISAAFEQYDHLVDILPAVGYSAGQLADLEATIAAVPCDAVVIGTPIDLARLIDIPQPHVRAAYSVVDASERGIDDVIDEFLAAHGLGA